MAAEGFNICIIGRNEEKIKRALTEVTALCKVKTMYVVFDFSEHVMIKDYEELIGDRLAEIDIAMLFLNAGFAQVGAFHDITQNEVEQQVTVNALQPAYTYKVLVDYMLARPVKSGVVIVSSQACNAPLPGLVTYSCTKTFVNVLGRGLSDEYKGRIDIMSWQPAEIKTKMIDTNSLKERNVGSEGVITVTDGVRGMLKHLGKDDTCIGTITHGMGNVIFSMIPRSWIYGMIYRECSQTYLE